MRKLLVLAGLLVLLPGSVAAERESRPRVLAYYVPYDPTSWASLEAHALELDIIGAQWVSIDACGNIGSHDDQTLNRLAQTRGTEVYPSLLTLSGWLNHRLLTDDDVSQHAIDEIVRYVIEEGYPGFDLDLEAVDPDDRDAFTAFVARLSSALHASDKTLSLAIPAKDRDVTTGWAGAYDYAALGPHGDLFTIMTYEYRGPFSGPGSIAPYAWADRVIAFATREIPARKVLMGLAFYGYDWNVSSGSARALSYRQATSLANRYGSPIALDPLTASATFQYQAPFGDPPPPGSGLAPLRHAITQRPPAECPVAAPPLPSPTPRRPPPPVDALQDHEVWLEDSSGVAQRLPIVERHGAGGVATWRLGQEDLGVWEVLRAWRGE